MYYLLTKNEASRGMGFEKKEKQEESKNECERTRGSETANVSMIIERMSYQEILKEK